MKRLSEIDYFRPIIIVLLVLMHSFTMYTMKSSTWPLPEGIQPVPGYAWVQEISFSFLLEAFTFISGYVFGYAVFVRKKEYSFFKLFTDKLNRLIIPSIIFGLLYTPLFYDKEIVLRTYMYDLICGIGHMWYLPMLFLCFLATWVINKIKVNQGIKIVFLFMVAILSARVPSAFRLNVVCYYLFFFYLGFVIIQKRDSFLAPPHTHHNWFKVCLLMYIILVVPLIMLRQYIQAETINMVGVSALAMRFCSKFVMLIYSTLGTISMLGVCVFLSKTHPPKEIIIEISGYCMGIYLLHQFVLKYLYYYTTLPSLVGSIWLPFVGFIIALTLSYGITYYSCKTKVGRWLFQ